MSRALLTQSRFPLLWRVFQFWIGGSVDKRRLCLKHYPGTGRVLEIGCSLGNISSAFRRFPGIDFTGIDIDPVVIRYATKSFADAPNFRFICQDLADFARRGETFDYVLFAGICHHVDDPTCARLFVQARGMLREGASLVVLDPQTPREEDSAFIHRFMRLERGQYVRPGEALRALLENTPGLRLVEAEEVLVGASPWRWPLCARFGLYRLARA